MLIDGKTNPKKAYVMVLDNNGLICKKELHPDIIKFLGIISSYDCDVIDICGKYVNWSIKTK